MDDNVSLAPPGFTYGSDLYNGTDTFPSSPADGAVQSDEAYKQFYLNAQFVTGLVCYPIGCLFGLTGNMLSMIVLSQRKMQTSTNVYLIALAVSDSIKLINDSFYFLTILFMHVDQPIGQKLYAYLYPYAHYFFNMSTCTTAWLTISVAAERYLMVCHATRARVICNIARARLTSALVFFTMSVLTIPFALRYKTVHKFSAFANHTVDVEVTRLWNNKLFVDIFTWFASLLRSIIPLIILCSLNYLIVQALRRTRTTQRRLSYRHRITHMLICVIVVFLICVTPDAVISTVFGIGYTDANYLFRGVREITDFLLLLNSAVNFVLYCTFNKIFRRNFMVLFLNRCTAPRPIAGEATFFRRSSFTSFRASVMNGSGLREDRTTEPPLYNNDYNNDYTQSAI